MGYLYAELGDFERAEVALRHALSAAARMGLRELAAAVLHNLGRVLGLRHNLDEARTLEQEAIDSFVEQGEQRLEGVARTYLAEILVAAGDFDAAHAEAIRAVEILHVRAGPARRGAGDGGAHAPAPGSYRRGDRARARRGRGSRAARRDRGRGGRRSTGASRLPGRERRPRGGSVPLLAQARAWLLARAARISEPSWRTRFMNEVPTNAKLLTSVDARSS